MPGRFATGVPIFKSLVWFNPESSPWYKCELNPWSATQEANALTTRPRRLYMYKGKREKKAQTHTPTLSNKYVMKEYSSNILMNQSSNDLQLEVYSFFLLLCALSMLCSEEKAKDFSSKVLSSCFFVVHNTTASCENKVPVTNIIQLHWLNNQLKPSVPKPYTQ